MNNTGSFPTQNVGLIYMNARYYMPEIGRFISADTIVPDPGEPQSYNRYSYTQNNPMNFTDPSGHCQGQYDPQTGQATADQGCWDYLYNEFCSGANGTDICTNWQQRILGARVGTCLGFAHCLISFGENWWTRSELETLSGSLSRAIAALDGFGFRGVFRNALFLRSHTPGDSVTFPALLITLRSVNEQAVWHELGHVISFQHGRIPQNEFFQFAGRSIPYYELGNFCYRVYCMTDYSTDPRLIEALGTQGALLAERYYTGEDYPDLWADAFAGWVYKQTYSVDPGWASNMPADWRAIYLGVEYSLAGTLP